MGGSDINLWALLKEVWLWADARALWILLGGLIAVGVLNGFLWQGDRARLERTKSQRVSPGDLLLTGARSPADALPRVSILLPAWNEAEYIRDCLESIRHLRYPKVETIICAGGQDGTLELARRYAPPGGLLIEQRPGEGKQRALQRCFECATGEVIFLTDADCVLDDNVFERTLYPILTGRDKVSSGTFRPLDHQQSHPLVAYQWAYHIYMQASLPEYTDALEGVNAAICRSALETVGGFGMPAPIGTDYLLSRQLRAAGYRIRFVPESCVQTVYCTRLGEYGRQRSRWFRNRLVYGWRFRAWRDILSHLWAGLTSLFMLAVPLAGGLGAQWLWVLWLVGLTHLLLSLARVICFARLQKGGCPHPWWQYGLFILYMVFGWIATVWGTLEVLIPTRRWRW